MWSTIPQKPPSQGESYIWSRANLLTFKAPRLLLTFPEESLLRSSLCAWGHIYCRGEVLKVSTVLNRSLCHMFGLTEQNKTVFSQNFVLKRALSSGAKALHTEKRNLRKIFWFKKSFLPINKTGFNSNQAVCGLWNLGLSKYSLSVFCSYSCASALISLWLVVLTHIWHFNLSARLWNLKALFMCFSSSPLHGKKYFGISALICQIWFFWLILLW